MNQTILKNPMTALARIVMAVVLFTGLATTARAQDDQEYKKAYNSGLEEARAKNYNAAYEAFEKAVTLARQAGDADVEKSARKVLTQIDYSRGTAKLKNEQWAAAIADFDKGIAHDASYSKNYYGKALALKNQNQWDEALAGYKKAIEVANAEGDRQVAQNALDAIRGQYIFLASSALAAENPTRAAATQALEHLSELENHVEIDADALYYRAEAYKALGQYAQAVATADQALEMHRGSRSDKAKIYFVKGEALMLDGQNEQAKLAFQEAQFGSFRAPAQHYLETL